MSRLKKALLRTGVLLIALLIVGIFLVDAAYGIILALLFLFGVFAGRRS